MPYILKCYPPHAVHFEMLSTSGGQSRSIRITSKATISIHWFIIEPIDGVVRPNSPINRQATLHLKFWIIIKMCQCLSPCTNSLIYVPASVVISSIIILWSSWPQKRLFSRIAQELINFSPLFIDAFISKTFLCRMRHGLRCKTLIGVIWSIVNSWLMLSFLSNSTDTGWFVTHKARYIFFLFSSPCFMWISSSLQRI